jgi:hypothetical protein
MRLVRIGRESSSNGRFGTSPSRSNTTVPRATRTPRNCGRCTSFKGRSLLSPRATQVTAGGGSPPLPRHVWAPRSTAPCAAWPPRATQVTAGGGSPPLPRHVWAPRSTAPCAAWPPRATQVTAGGGSPPLPRHVWAPSSTAPCAAWPPRARTPLGCGRGWTATPSGRGCCAAAAGPSR